MNYAHRHLMLTWRVAMSVVLYKSLTKCIQQSDPSPLIETDARVKYNPWTVMDKDKSEARDKTTVTE